MMTICLIAQTDFQFAELYTANNRKYRVTLNIDSVLFWQGYLLQGQYQEEYKGPPYVNEFIAADQLGYIKTLAWDDLELTSPKNDIQILETVLGATDLEFDLQEGVNVYETNHSSTSADSPLDQTYTDANVFDGKTYYDVLYDTLFKYQAVIKQRAGEWFIYRPREATAAYNLRKWTLAAGSYSYDSVQSYDPIVSTTSATVSEANLVRITPGGAMFIQPAWGRYTMTHDMALRESFLENYDFTQWSDSDPKFWNKIRFPVWITGTFSHSKIGNALKINAEPTPLVGKYFEQTISIDDDTVYQVLKLAFDFDVYVPLAQSMTVYIQVSFDLAKWFDPDSASWSSTTKYITKTYDNTGGATALQQNEKLEYISPQITGFTPNTIYVRLFTPIYNPGSSLSFVQFNKAECVIMSRPSAGQVDSFTSETNYSGIIDADNDYKPDDIEISIGDAPTASYPNAGEIWDGVLFLNGGKSDNTYEWTADGRTSTLIGLMKANFTDFFQYPQQVLSVKVYTKSIDACTVLREINNTTTSNKYFMIKRASWEAQAGYWEIEAHQLAFAFGEVVSPGDAKILLETGDKILLETGDEIIKE